MWELFKRYYAGTHRQSFTRDLLNKDRVFVLSDEQGIKGFNSLVIKRIHSWRVMFSGDMLIASDVRGMGSTYMLQAWAQSIWHQCDWWCALASGPRTFRLPFMLFNRVVPNETEAETGEEIQLRHLFAQHAYGKAYSKKTGIVQLDQAYVLRPEHADLRANYPLDSFFKSRNPGWYQGDEVVSLISTRPENWSRKARRLVGDVLT